MTAIYSKVTVINRTAYDLYYAVENDWGTYNSNKIRYGAHSTDASSDGFLAPGDTVTATVSGDSTASPFKVGVCNQPIASGNPVTNNNGNGVHGVITHGVYNNAVVTISTEMGVHVKNE